MERKDFKDLKSLKIQFRQFKTRSIGVVSYVSKIMVYSIINFLKIFTSHVIFKILMFLQIFINISILSFKQKV